MTDINIKITGLDVLQAALGKFPNEVKAELGGLSKDVADLILDETGLRAYPPLTAANLPPTPFYIRGRGTEAASGNKGNSERYGTQFYVKAEGYTTTIGNRASYAKYLGGEEQAAAMARIGWRKLFDVAAEKLDAITALYQRGIDRLIVKLGLGK